jgi:hypothetical protein
MARSSPFISHRRALSLMPLMLPTGRPKELNEIPMDRQSFRAIPVMSEPVSIKNGICLRIFGFSALTLKGCTVLFL